MINKKYLYDNKIKLYYVNVTHNNEKIKIYGTLETIEETIKAYFKIYGGIKNEL